MKDKLKTIFLFLAIIVNSGLLFVYLYNASVDLSNWGVNIPSSLDTAKKYFTVKKPEDFFKILNITIHIIGINCIFRLWKTDKHIRLYTLAAFILIILVDSLTTFYFAPRNEIMLGLKDIRDIQILGNVYNEWNFMSWIRLFITLLTVMFYGLSLNKLYGVN